MQGKKEAFSTESSIGWMAPVPITRGTNTRCISLEKEKKKEEVTDSMCVTKRKPQLFLL